jgi:hypothetical protein
MNSISIRTCALGLCIASFSTLSLWAHPLPEHFFFQPATNLGPTINSSSIETSPTLMADGLTMVFSSTRPGFGDNDLWITTRSTATSAWSAPVNLGATVNGMGRESGPEISGDGLTLLFYSIRPGGFGQQDIWETRRESIAAPWGMPINLGPGINTSAEELGSSLSNNGLTLVFDSDASRGGFGLNDLWISTRASTADAWPAATNLGSPINSAEYDLGPNISSDGLTFTFERNGELWMARRDDVNSPWGPPNPFEGSINRPSTVAVSFLVADNRTLFFRSDRPGGFGSGDIWTSVAEPAIYYTRFTSAMVGARSDTAMGIELGFDSVVLAGDPDGPSSQFGIRDEFGHTFRMRTVDAQLTTDAVDLRLYENASASIDLRISTTSWEADDFLRVELTDGDSTVLVASATGTAQLNAWEGGWQHFRATIPNDWSTARFIVTSSTDSSTGAETVDIDNVAFFGTQVIPEPASWALFVMGGAVGQMVSRIRRNAKSLGRAASGESAAAG